MEIPTWVVVLRTTPGAWESYMTWLAERRQQVLERTAKTWDDEKERQGEKKALDNIIHLSTIDQKSERELKSYLGVK